MAQFHPDIHWLVDYSSGNMPLANALCVSAHLEFCGRCREKVAELNALGGSLLRASSNNQVAEAVTGGAQDEALASVFSAIDALESSGVQPAADARSTTHGDCTQRHDGDLPGCVQKLVPGGVDALEWKNLGRTLSVARLAVGDREHEVALHRLRAGGGVGNHDHRGEEITVVLKGSFSDQRGLYLPGDFLLMEEGDQHKPTATANMDCICLSSVQAPIRFTGPVSRLLNPFLKIHPAA